MTGLSTDTNESGGDRFVERAHTRSHIHRRAIHVLRVLRAADRLVVDWTTVATNYNDGLPAHTAKRLKRRLEALADECHAAVWACELVSGEVSGHEATDSELR